MYIIDNYVHTCKYTQCTHIQHTIIIRTYYINIKENEMFE